MKRLFRAPAELDLELFDVKLARYSTQTQSLLRNEVRDGLMAVEIPGVDKTQQSRNERVMRALGSFGIWVPFSVLREAAAVRERHGVRTLAWLEREDGIMEAHFPIEVYRRDLASLAETATQKEIAVHAVEEMYLDGLDAAGSLAQASAGNVPTVAVYRAQPASVNACR